MKTVIEMAREAGLVTNYGGRETASDKLLERFAQLVRAEAQAEEREACAKVCETKGAIKYAGLTIGEQCAAAIRTRSDK